MLTSLSPVCDAEVEDRARAIIGTADNQDADDWEAGYDAGDGQPESTAPEAWGLFRVNLDEEEVWRGNPPWGRAARARRAESVSVAASAAMTTRMAPSPRDWKKDTGTMSIPMRASTTVSSTEQYGAARGLAHPFDRRALVQAPVSAPPGSGKL